MLADEKQNWERDEPAARLSIAEITRLLDPWLAGRDVLDAELLSGGLMNRNVLLRLSGRPAECVLRVYDRDPSSCAREVAVLGMIGRDVPVPRVFYADEAGEHGPPLAVLSAVDGISLFTLRSMGDDEALAAASYAAGRVLPSIGKFPGPPTPAETVGSLVERFGGTAVYQQRVPAALHERLLAVVNAWQPRLEEVSLVHGLVHCDFNSRNVFVARDGDGWRVSAVLDWEFAIDASPFVDVGNFLRYHRPERPCYEPQFSRGLRDGGMLLPDDWLMIARLMDAPALCELLTRPRVPASVVGELIDLLERMTDG